ncbi:hypothetical protein MGG_15811 [Pyricularia oryzae 70-15]|uniref:Kinetochore protein fta4 n=4 Tax=Pyricularia oryzae TaxID=318829 RepID=G4MXS7_PYRO7|nr:uncharacterized protein MGG_15811 [Pyricularia oryzae 70-15]ELQ39591.1 hypothetical protein OOU_Y34scaffold00492g25 [Pyricularia oryzae Y34]KAI7917045.1 hypothetical protein M9X92_007557 [Pyricularia oryzae]EHA55214.1 hypothetical protein MGG_15811 [Pyricularia oryzae 70-15]KAI7917927.1 hypothetical protein M0657_007844 [Pyricularia oryzae]QBZ56891.1 hypothetical protein PoMZ_01809 [Pyricularia oryzae]
MSSAAPPTILTLKQELIAEQVRLLSQPLAPSRAWRAGNNASAQAAGDNGGSAAGATIPERAVEAAMVRVNHRLHQHVNRVYASAATRHVAEQLEQLYLIERERATELHPEGNELQAMGISSSTDFADAKTISALPENWPLEKDAETYPVEVKRFAELAESLKELSVEREALLLRVRRLRALRDGLAPFQASTDDTVDDNAAAAHVQRHLVTKNGELEQELERTRILMARVGGRVARLIQKESQNKASTVGSNDEDSLFEDREDSVPVALEEDARRKVNDLLDRF